MKLTFTFTSFMFLFTLVGFGNITETSHNEKIGKSRFEKSFKGFNSNNTQSWQGHRIAKKRISTDDFMLKSAQAIKQRLDGYSSQIWDDSTSEWKPSDKVDFIYDTNWKLTLELDYTWDESTSQWINDWKSEFTYDANGKLTQDLYFGFDETNSQIIGLIKNTYTYDANGNLTQELHFDYDITTSLLAVNGKRDYSYDANGNITQEIGSYWNKNTNQLEAILKNDYQYNGIGKETIKVSSSYDNTTSQWMQMSKNESTYDSNGNLTLYLQSSWDGMGSWYASDKDEYSYDTKGNLTQHLQFLMESSQWIGSEKNTYLFDNEGNNTQEIDYYGWDQQTSQWNEIWKVEYTFDNNYAFNDLIMPFSDKEVIGIFTHMITNINEYTWNINTSEWVSDYNETFIYSAQNVTSVKHLDAERLNIYPNPCSKSVSVSTPDSYSQISFELFDPQGRKLFAKAIVSNEKVNIEGLGSGMYIYKLTLDGKMQSGKLIKQ